MSNVWSYFTMVIFPFSLSNPQRDLSWFFGETGMILGGKNSWNYRAFLMSQFPGLLILTPVYTHPPTIHSSYQTCSYQLMDLLGSIPDRLVFGFPCLQGGSLPYHCSICSIFFLLWGEEWSCPNSVLELKLRNTQSHIFNPGFSTLGHGPLITLLCWPIILPKSSICF